MFLNARVGLNHHAGLAYFCPHWHPGLSSLATSGCVCVWGCEQEEQGPLSAQLSLPQGSARLHSVYVGFHRSSPSWTLTNSRTARFPVLSTTHLVPNSLQRSLSGNFPEDPIHPRALAPDVCRSDKGSDKHTPSPVTPSPYINLALCFRGQTRNCLGVCQKHAIIWELKVGRPCSRVNSHPFSKTRAI